jgi:predicted RNase H-like nuclease
MTRASPSHSFIGIDLAWKIDGNHSAIAVLAGNQRQARLEAISTGITSMAGIVEFVARHAQSNCVVAIDASLVVRNQTGQRPCETLIAKTFGRHHASCHTTNLGRPHAETGMRLAEALGREGFLHDFAIETARLRRGRWLCEVYPHPAMVRIFGLQRIIQYKKGSVVQRRRGLSVLRQYLAGLAAGQTGLVSSPTLRTVLAQNLQDLRGAALKRYEDTLDGIFCAYLAWHCWRWGAARNEMYGSLEHGYIVVPRPPAYDIDEHSRTLILPGKRSKLTT